VHVVGPLRRIRTGAAQHQAADGVDQSGLLRNRDELGRRDHAALGMRPTHQRLEAGDAPARKIDQRLVLRPQRIVLIASRRSISILRRVWARVHPALEEGTCRANRSCARQRHVGVLEQLLESSPPPGDIAMPMLAPITTECPSSR
jgi:hypothetical protein